MAKRVRNGDAPLLHPEKARRPGSLFRRWAFDGFGKASALLVRRPAVPLACQASAPRIQAKTAFVSVSLGAFRIDLFRIRFDAFQRAGQGKGATVPPRRD